MSKDAKHKGPLHKRLVVEAREKARAEIMERADEIFERYIHGESIKAICDSLRLPMPSHMVRYYLLNSPETADRYQSASIMRSHYLVESAVELGMQAAAIGDAAGLRVAVDTAFKMAAKLNQAQYGDANKVELTGKDGGALEVKADLTLTAEQAYERLIKGK